MLEIAVTKRSCAVELPVVAEEFIAGRDEDVITVKRDSAQASVGTTAFEVDAAGIPVDYLPAVAFLKVDDVDTTMAFALLAASDDRRRDNLGQF